MPLDSSYLPGPGARRVMDAIAFRTPDRLPRWDSFSKDGHGVEFVAKWRQWKDLPSDVVPADFYEIDVSMSMAEEGPCFSTSGVVGRDGDYELYRGPWGNLVRRRSDASFAEPLDPAFCHVRPLIELGQGGGLIIGSASIGNDVTPAAYDHYAGVLRKYGQYHG